MTADKVLPDRARVVAETLRFLAGGWLQTEQDCEWAADTARAIEATNFNGLGYHSACCPLCQEVSCDEDCPLAALRIGAVRCTQRACPNTGELLRNCKCRSCIGRRNRRKGKRGQRDARRALGLASEKWSGREANEETWSAAVRVEVKTGGRIANPIGIRYNQCKDQSEATRPVGDVRPFVAVFRPDDWSDVLVVIKGSDLPAAVAALVTEWAE